MWVGLSGPLIFFLVAGNFRRFCTLHLNDACRSHKVRVAWKKLVWGVHFIWQAQYLAKFRKGWNAILWGRCCRGMCACGENCHMSYHFGDVLKSEKQLQSCGLK